MDHENLEMKKLINSNEYNFFAICPTLNQPILINIKMEKV